jgi:hypothetical protein
MLKTMTDKVMRVVDSADAPRAVDAFHLVVVLRPFTGGWLDLIAGHWASDQ